MPVPKEQPPRKLSGHRDRSDTKHSGERRIASAEGIAISGTGTEGAFRLRHLAVAFGMPGSPSVGRPLL